MKARQIVEEMDSYVPGRSQDEIASDFNLKKEDIIKLGSNENPWGPSPKAMKEAFGEGGKSCRYLVFTDLAADQAEQYFVPSTVL